jgi:hypothetical protein
MLCAPAPAALAGKKSTVPPVTTPPACRPGSLNWSATLASYSGLRTREMASDQPDSAAQDTEVVAQISSLARFQVEAPPGPLKIA